MNPVQTKPVPDLRFPEFSEGWGKRVLLEMSEGKLTNGVFNDPKKVGSGYRIINVKDMYVGDYIDVNSLTLLHLDEKEFAKNKVNYGDLFFTRSSIVKEGIAHTNVCLSHDDDITYDGHLIRMRPRQDIALPLFLAYFFTTSLARKQLISRGKTTTMTTIGQEDIASVYIVAPKKNEQQKIADFLTAVDKRIEQLEEKKRLLTEYKKGVMQQIFSQQIRFKDDNGNPYPAWEEKRLGDVFLERSERGFETLELLSVTRNNGVVKRSEIEGKDNSSSDKSNYKRVSSGDIVYNSMRMWQGASGLSPYDGIVSPAYTILKPRPKVVPLYFAYLFKFTPMVFVFRRNSQGLTSDTWNLKYPTLSTIKVQVPDSSEQQKIADFLTSISTKIEQVASQLEQAKAFKKGLLQQMFV